MCVAFQFLMPDDSRFKVNVNFNNGQQQQQWLIKNAVALQLSFHSSLICAYITCENGFALKIAVILDYLRPFPLLSISLFLMQLHLFLSLSVSTLSNHHQATLIIFTVKFLK